MSTSVFAEKPPLVSLVCESIRMMMAEIFLSKGEHNSELYYNWNLLNNIKLFMKICFKEKFLFSRKFKKKSQCWFHR